MEVSTKTQRIFIRGHLPTQKATRKLNREFTENDRVLFLDFDGVLNSNRYNQFKSTSANIIDPTAVELLNDIVKKTDCVIVISSAWRTSNTIQALIAHLKGSGFNYGTETVIGTTIINDLSHRGLEVQDWLFLNKHRGKFIILDDLPREEFGFVGDWLIQTDINYGLTQAEADRIIKYFIS